MSNYDKHEHHDFMTATRVALGDARLQNALGGLADTLLSRGRVALAAFGDSGRLRDHAKRIKEHTLAHLDHYLEQLEASIVRAGGQVHWAADAAEACGIVIDIARKTNCVRIVKSKSMTTEEIHLNPALEAAAFEVVETDFGEYILQLAGERPSHLIAPAVHHTKETIAGILSAETGADLPADPVVLAQTGRRLLREKFRQADMGITGGNFLVAETGTLALVTNEGNGRLTTTCPRIHVALVGIEKVIPRLADLPVFLKLLGRAATGQILSVYTTMVTGPRQPGERDGPEEFHLVLLDNGRSRVLGTPFRESLQCIRCGACLNACPVYRRIGGHAYGGVYAGPIGSILTPLYDSVQANPHLPHASSLCGACLEACPVRINIPHMLIGLRELQHEGGKVDSRQHTVDSRNATASVEASAPRVIQSTFAFARRVLAMAGGYRYWLEGLTYRFGALVLSRPRIYRMTLKAARATMRPWARDGWVRKLPGPGAGWTAARDFPAPAAKPFHERWQELA